MSQAAQVIGNALKEGRRFLLEPEALALCRQYGISVPRFDVAHDTVQALSMARDIGYPVVIKVISTGVIHKSDVGGVVMSLQNSDQLKLGWERIMKSVAQKTQGVSVAGVLVEEMVQSGKEVIVGGMKDSQFGNVVMFGLGGVFTELLKDVSFRAAPLTMGDAREMMEEVKGYPILAGLRGEAPADLGALAKVLVSASKLLEENDEVAELDLNPVIASATGAVAVDARIGVETPKSERAVR